MHMTFHLNNTQIYTSIGYRASLAEWTPVTEQGISHWKMGWEHRTGLWV